MPNRDKIDSYVWERKKFGDIESIEQRIENRDQI